MLSPRNSPRALARNLLKHLLGQILANMHALRLGRERDRWDGAGMLVDEPLLALVPRREQLGRRRGAAVRCA